PVLPSDLFDSDLHRPLRFFKRPSPLVDCNGQRRGRYGRISVRPPASSPSPFGFSCFSIVTRRTWLSLPTRHRSLPRTLDGPKQTPEQLSRTGVNDFLSLVFVQCLASRAGLNGR